MLTGRASGLGRQKGAQQAVECSLREPLLDITLQTMAAEDVATSQPEAIRFYTVVETDLAVVRLSRGEPIPCRDISYHLKYSQCNSKYDAKSMEMK